MATDLGKAYVQIVPSAQGISGSINRLLSGEATNAGNSAGLSIGQKLVSNIKKIVAGAGIGMFIKQAISEGAKLEQSIGGIETLFGTRGASSVEEYAKLVGKSVDSVAGKYGDLQKSQETMLSYANNAWKTVGVSANTYMENVTSFSASLLQGLGGDTLKASTIANQAMIDMADNANKFGTDIQSIQNAYQGFAKQNYTMLDNLKLGYGGTKTEMQRLINDASKLTSVQKELGLTVNANDMSFANIAKAISVVQKNMGIAGTTALEAMTTVSGSMNAMRASYQNLMSSLALGQNVGDSFKALVETSGIYAKNVLAMVGNIAKEIPGVIVSGMSELSSQLTNLNFNVKTMLPQVIDGASEVISTFVSTISERAAVLFRQGLSLASHLADGIVNSLPTIISSIGNVTSTIFDTLAGMFENFTTIGANILGKIGEGLQTGIPQFASTILPLILSFTTRIRESLPQFVSAGMNMLVSLAKGFGESLPVLIAYVPKIISNIAGLINDNMPTILLKGVEIIKTLGQGLISAIPALISNMGSIVQMMIDVIQAINWIGLGSNIITFIKQGIQNMFNAIPNLMKNIGDTALNFVKKIDWHGLGRSIIEFIKNGIVSLVNAIPTALRNIGNTAIEWVKNINWIQLGKDIIDLIKNGIVALALSIPNAIKNICNDAWNAVKQIDWFGLGKNITDGMASGVRSGQQNVVSAVGGVARSASDMARATLVISSPSRVFKYYGEMIDAGLAQGIDENVGLVTDAMSRITNATIDSYSPDLGLDYGVSAVSGNSALNGGFNQVINNYSPKALSPSETARLTRNSTRQMVLGLRIGG